MKQLLILLFPLFCLNTVLSQNFTKEDVIEIKSILQKGAKLQYDEHAGIIWVKSKPIDIIRSTSLEPNSSTMSIYFGLTKINGEIRVLPLRITNELILNDWLFFEDISFLYGTLKDKKEGTREQFSMGAGETKRVVRGSVYVSEKSDVIMNSDMKELIIKMIENPKPLSIRYQSKDTSIEKFYALGLKAFNNKFRAVMDTYEKAVVKFKFVTD